MYIHYIFENNATVYIYICVCYILIYLNLLLIYLNYWFLNISYFIEARCAKVTLYNISL